jgi:2-dehydro-3-deoxyphosphogluconate aldolase/(4S)-4-hydroxy-2-oxoglutarate aldolase
MNPQTAYEMIAEDGLVAGMRGHFPPDVALEVCRVMLEEGIRGFEFTTNSTQAIEAMQAAKREFGDSAVVGMGTVLNTELARRVLDAGADMIIAPSFSRAVVQMTHDAGVLMVPGVITPTECVDAWEMGCKLLKIFPIGSLGLDYFKSIRGPLDHYKFMCNGGMKDTNVSDFLKAGAVACGMANWLTGDGRWPMDKIRERARTLKRVVAEARDAQPVK